MKNKYTRPFFSGLFLLLFAVNGAGCSPKSAAPAAPAPAPAEAEKKKETAPEPLQTRVYQQPSHKPVPSKCAHGACFKTEISFSDTVFELQGIALRKYLWVNVYSAAFYRPENTEVSADRTGGVPSGPKMIILEYHRQIEKKKIVDSIDQSVRSNPYIDAASVKKRFDVLTEAFDEPQAGARYQFIYIPGKGTALHYKGAERVLIPGDDFADAFFGVWLADLKANTMREELLGRAGG